PCSPLLAVRTSWPRERRTSPNVSSISRSSSTNRISAMTTLATMLALVADAFAMVAPVMPAGAVAIVMIIVPLVGPIISILEWEFGVGIKHWRLDNHPRSIRFRSAGTESNHCYRQNHGDGSDTRSRHISFSLVWFSEESRTYGRTTNAQ